jgi:hypothetical protein
MQLSIFCTVTATGWRCSLSEEPLFFCRGWKDTYEFMCLLIKQPNYDFSGYPNAYCLTLATLMLCELVSITWFLVVKYVRGRMRLRTAQQNSGDSNGADSVRHEADDIRHYNSPNLHLRDFPPAYSENIEMTTPSHRTSGTPHHVTLHLRQLPL